MSSKMSLLSLPSAGEALLYVKNNGLRRSLGKLICGYIAGQQRWHLTCEDLTKYVGAPLEARGFEFRFARTADLARMQAFTTRISLDILRVWCGSKYAFFLTLKDGQPVSYRCLSTFLHPGVVGFVRLRRDQIFMVDEFTVPAFRRRGITRQMAIAMTPVLLQRGYREVLGVHRVDNADTIAAARAKGIPTIGTITRTCLLWKTAFQYAPAAPSRPTPIAEPIPGDEAALAGIGTFIEPPLIRREAA